MPIFAVLNNNKMGRRGIQNPTSGNRQPPLTSTLYRPQKSEIERLAPRFQRQVPTQPWPPDHKLNNTVAVGGREQANKTCNPSMHAQSLPTGPVMAQFC